MTKETQNQTENNGSKTIETIKNNSEILFLYDAKMCNPNGDPDDENKPRMDYIRNINLVSDVRLKRYIRDYLMNHKKQEIFVCKVEGETVDATNRLKKLIDKYAEEIKKDEKMKDLFKNNKPDEKKLSNYLPWLLSKLTDVRLFGATMPLKSEKEKRDNVNEYEIEGATMPLKSEKGKGTSISFTGPVQFNWGYSLNKVIGPMESNTITSTFAGADSEHSTMGKDYRIAYSLIAFHGIISAKRAEHTELTDKDIELFDDAMINAIPMEATTRSKTGQEPLLYIRVEYTSADFFSGDFRRYIKIKDKKWDDTTKLGSITDYILDLSELKTKLETHKNMIKDIYFWKHQDLKISGFDELGNMKEWEVKNKENVEEKTRKIRFIKLPQPKEERQQDVQQ